MAVHAGKQAIKPVTDEQWQAVITNDAAYDGTFYYAVKTTGIFCRPSCKSRPPKRENIGAFVSADEALAAQYKPCKRCKPTGTRLPDEEWISLVTHYIDTHYAESLSLDSLASISHGSPYHLHRTFKRVTGMTPVEYIQQVRMGRAQEMLRSSQQTVKDIGVSVGFSNTPYFITLFKRMTGVTPESYRQGQKISKQEEGSDHES